MKPSQYTYFQVKTDLIYLEEVLLQFESVKQDWIRQKDWLQCQLALAEGFTNAVRHAHRNKPLE
ncbi:ATP-binding protein, partial [Geminocystis sp. GBBB08]|uniref:ATP-binding protein n=1 Tax=Geminocystis sp. GBBB08 TaxID=2604140 RepID=UPI002927D385|nr:ATP-binding protein [Geminocystis sp. GBBB08]